MAPTELAGAETMPSKATTVEHFQQMIRIGHKPCSFADGVPNVTDLVELALITSYSPNSSQLQHGHYALFLPRARSMRMFMQKIRPSRHLLPVQVAAEFKVYSARDAISFLVLGAASLPVDRLDLGEGCAGRAPDEKERPLLFQHLVRLGTLSGIVEVKGPSCLIVGRQVKR
jgi:hypothetical protein